MIADDSGINAVTCLIQVKRRAENFGIQGSLRRVQAGEFLECAELGFFALRAAASVAPTDSALGEMEWVERVGMRPKPLESIPIRDHLVAIPIANDDIISP